MTWHDHKVPEERTFSVLEANEMIPTLRRHLTRIREAQKILSAIQGEIRRASLQAPYGGGSRYGTVYLRALDQVNHSLHELEETGVLLKDLESGLCDFPHRHDGRIVYLCWKLGEEEISWWHEVHSGFQGRQSIARLVP